MLSERIVLVKREHRFARQDSANFELLSLSPLNELRLWICCNGVKSIQLRCISLMKSRSPASISNFGS